MEDENLDVTPAVTVHNLLQAFPQLEEVLIGIAPPFKKLNNPILRKSVAKVATIKHISAVGKVPLEDLINTLRKAAGQSVSTTNYDNEEYFLEQPDWFHKDKIVVSIDEATIEDKNQMALVTLMKKAKDVEPGEIIELLTNFLPAPGIDIMKSKGYSVWSIIWGWRADFVVFSQE